jgi:hypothetical protein
VSQQGPATMLERSVPAGLLQWEGALVCALASACFVAIPIVSGAMGISWDALNHHIYLGWTAEQQRFDLDFLAAGYQSFVSPYLYWPMYKMATAGWSGEAAGVVLALLHVIAVWPVWMLARACVPGPALFDMALRILATALAFMSGLILSAFGSSMNDLLAAAPLVWAVALAMEPAARLPGMPARVARRYVLLSGACAGMAVALKLSNGPLAILMPALWLLSARGLGPRLAAVALGGLGTVLAFLVGYGYWGWLLWRYFGNPVFPFYDSWFAPLRAWLGWVG